MKSIAGKWGYSHDNESYSNGYATRDEAIAAAELEEPGEPYWIGQYRDPSPPEECVDAERMLETLFELDDYSCEWCQDILFPRPADLQTLNEALRSVFVEWWQRVNGNQEWGIIVDGTLTRQGNHRDPTLPKPCGALSRA